MKVLIHFLQSRNQRFFEALSLRTNLEKALTECGVEYSDKFSREVDIANFISLNVPSRTTIKQCVLHSIPTLLWMFFANTDDDAKIITYDKNGKMFIPRTKRETIKTMDAIVVPTVEAKVLLRSLNIRIPIVVLQSGFNPDYMLKETANEQNLFKRYFRISGDKEYAISVANLRDEKHLAALEKLARAKEDMMFYCFVSAKDTLLNGLRLTKFNSTSPKNFVLTKIVPEDVFRQGLKGAKYFIHLGEEKAGTMTLLEPLVYKVPIIIHKEAIFSDMLDKNSAHLISDFNSALYILRNEEMRSMPLANATAYVEKYNFSAFTKALCQLFNQIHMR